MKVSFSWLTSLVDISASAEELAEKLSLSGTEVEGIEHVGENISGIITARITKIAPHPNADRLVVTTLTDGNTDYQVVTGATNVVEGAIVPLSKVGATLANGMTIKHSKLRGVPSEGMLCSEAELGIQEDADGIWILPEDTPIGVDFITYANLKDTVLEIAILPNRGDCQSMLGLAREVAVLYNTSYKRPEILEAKQKTSRSVQIDNQNFTLCPSYTARVIEDVSLKPTPLWMQRRLQLAGIRPINNIVDITNYVLLETGQPLHAFDYDTLDHKHIFIRPSHKKEQITTLDGEQLTLPENSVLICDGKTPIALGGIMGGKDSEVSNTTQHLVLEAAAFDPISIRRSSQSIGLRTESAIRFEKGIDIEQVAWASHRATFLFKTYADAKHCGKIISDEDPALTKKEPHLVPFDAEKINALLGTTFNEKDQTRVLDQLGFIKNKSGSQVSVPSWRTHDIVGLPDLAEEIARIIGYDHIPSTLPKQPVALAADSFKERYVPSLRQFLCHNGYSQVMTLPMISEKDITAMALNPKHKLTLKNPLSSEESIMRPTLLPSLMKTAAYNLNRQQSNLKLFEISHTFQSSSSKTWREVLVISGIAIGKRNPDLYRQDQQKENELTFFDIKGILSQLLQLLPMNTLRFSTETAEYFHPKQSHSVFHEETHIGSCGILHPTYCKHYGIQENMAYFTLSLSDCFKEKELPTCRVFSKFPYTRRDIALLVPTSISYETLFQMIQECKPDIASSVRLFDHFSSDALGADHVSMAFSLIYQHPDRSLSDKEVNKAHDHFCRSLVEKVPNISIR